jgi:Fe2+ or Zn2+ uptake regulation protein
MAADAPAAVDAPARAIQRSTRQLALVLAAVQDSGPTHPTADAIWTTVRRVLPRISRGTVYRNLQRLAADGRIAIAHVGGRTVRWDPTLAPHDHFVCERCGRVDDLGSELPAASVAAAERSGHRVRAHATVLYGRCASCRTIA